VQPAIRIVATALALTVAAAPLGAQQRDLVLKIYGGGADHLADLQSAPTVWQMPGYNLGASVGIQLSRRFAVYGDFTYTRNPSQGSSSFAGSDINHFYYGALLEARYPLGQWAPFAFVGVGGVSVDILGPDQFEPFTKPAAMLGGGVSFGLPGTRLGAFGQVKGITYKWDRGGFDRQLFDVTYSLGLSYRPPVRLPF
jgi:hypothetical protein